MDAVAKPADGRRRRIPFLDHLGVELIAFGQGRSELAFDVRPELCNSTQVVHGGVLMTTLDAALAIAARAAHTDDYDAQVNAITVEMKTTFVRPVTGRLTVRGECVHKATSLMFCEGEVRDAENRLIARANGTFKLWNRRREPDPSAARDGSPDPSSTTPDGGPTPSGRPTDPAAERTRP